MFILGGLLSIWKTDRYNDLPRLCRSLTTYFTSTDADEMDATAATDRPRKLVNLIKSNNSQQMYYAVVVYLKELLADKMQMVHEYKALIDFMDGDLEHSQTE